MCLKRMNGFEMYFDIKGIYFTAVMCRFYNHWDNLKIWRGNCLPLSLEPLTFAAIQWRFHFAWIKSKLWDWNTCLEILFVCLI